MVEFCHTRKQYALAREGDRILSLGSIAGALGGKVRGNKVVAPGPEAASQRLKWKQRRRTLTVYLSHDGRDIRANCHHPSQDYRQAKDWVRSRCGIVWKPKPRAPRKKIERGANPASNAFFAETLKICRERRKITLPQLVLLINDLRVKWWADSPLLILSAEDYAREFGFNESVIGAMLAAPLRHYKADTRAKIFNLHYAERQQLKLRRTGSIDVDKAGRDRKRRERDNARKRANRAAAKRANAVIRLPVASISMTKFGKVTPSTILSYSSMGITKNPSVRAREINSNSPQNPKIARAQGP